MTKNYKSKNYIISFTSQQNINTYIRQSMKPMQSKFSRPTTAKKPLQPEKPLAKTVVNEPANDIDHHIDQLIRQQKQFEKQGKYIQAQKCKRQVKQLQQQSQKRYYVQIRERHERQRQQIEEAHLQQLNCFNIQWNQKMAQLQKDVSQMEEELLARHLEQMRITEQQADAEKAPKFKQSPQLLNLKKIQQQLAKQQSYIQAHQVQIRVQKLQKQQMQKHKRQYNKQSKVNINILKQKQDNQMSALRQRIDLVFDQKTRQKNQEHQQIMLKYQNVLKQLDYQQKQEIMKFQKAAKLKTVQKKTKSSLMSTSKVSLK